jgi:hypothetical protein
VAVERGAVLPSVERCVEPGQGIAGLLKIGSGSSTDRSGDDSDGRIAPTTAAMLGQSSGPGGTLSALDRGRCPVSM